MSAAKMTRSNPDDVSIGEDRWLPFVGVVGRQNRAVELDPFIAPLESFWAALESECVAGCCGISAFSLWPENIRAACVTAESSEVRNHFIELRRFIENSESDIFVSSRLNNYFDRTLILAIIDHIVDHLDVAPQARPSDI